MAVIRGFSLPDDLYYLVEKHVWARRIDGDVIRVGMSEVAYHLLGHSLVAITPRAGVVGSEVPNGGRLAMVESLKYIGPLPAPLAGRVLRTNGAVVDQPSIAEDDPYEAGWIVEMRAADWHAATESLLTGDAAMTAYRALLASQNIEQSRSR